MILSAPIIAQRRAIASITPTESFTPALYGTPSSGFTQSPAGTYSGMGYAVATFSLAPGSDITYTEQWGGMQQQDVVIGISDNNTNTAYTAYAFGFFVYSLTGNYSYTIGSGSIVGTGVSPVSGDRYGIKIENRATSATYTVGYVRAGVWVPLYTNATITGVNVTIYFKADIAGMFSVLLNPGFQ